MLKVVLLLPLQANSGPNTNGCQVLSLSLCLALMLEFLKIPSKLVHGGYKPLMDLFLVVHIFYLMDWKL